MKILKILLILAVCISFWSCCKKSPLDISQMELDEPNAPPTINTDNLMEGNDYSVGYYNGNIRSDRVKLEWSASEDDNFLCYKILRGTGDGPGGFFEGFESGSLPPDWTTYGDFGGWYVTDEDSYEGNYYVRSHEGNYGYEYLETTVSVPQDTDIFISFWVKGYNDGEGRFKINDYTIDYWYPSTYWQGHVLYYNTGANTSITLEWRYYTGYYGYGMLDNIEVTGIGGNFSLIETLNNKNTTTYWDTTLTQNQYYTYKIATIVKEGTHKVDEVTIKTPRWESPSNFEVIGLSPTIVKLNWEDNSESETAFKIYVDTLDVYPNYVTIDSLIAGKNDTTKTIEDLKTEPQYRFRIKAINNWEEGTPTINYSGFTFDFYPPSNLYASQVSGTKAVNLSWNDNSTLENGFLIERKVNAGIFSQIATAGQNVTEYTDYDTLSLEYGDTLTYRVRVYNDYSETIYTNYSDSAVVILTEIEPYRTLKYWVKAGPEEVDSGENLEVYYYSNSGSWVLIRSINYYEADFTWTYFEDEISNPNAMHSEFKIKFEQNNHSGWGCDNWYIDNVELVAGQSTIFADDFTSGISWSKWQTQNGVYLSSSYYISAPYSIYFDGDYEREIITINIPW